MRNPDSQHTIPSLPRRLSTGALIVLLAATGVVILQSSLELTQRGGIHTLEWVLQHPFRALLNLLLLLPFCVVLHRILVRPLRTLAAWTALVVSLALVNALKLEFMQIPLLPRDFLLIGNASLLIGFIPISIRWGIALALGSAIAWTVWRTTRRRTTPPSEHAPAGRFAPPTFAVGVILSLPGVLLWGHLISNYRPLSLPTGRGHKERVIDLSWNQAENALRNGMIAAWAMNLRSPSVAPAKYDAQAIGRVLNPWTPARSKTSTTQNPDLIVVMVESWFDPQRLPGIRFSRDPMPRLRRLMKEPGMSGQVVVPSFGGLTANTEFEILSGLSNAFLPDGAIPYQGLIRGVLRSLPWDLRDRGYRAWAVHNYRRNYWRRNEVYDYLGFDRYWGLEDLDSSGFDTEGWRIDDRVLEKKIDELLAASDASDAPPQFIWAVTMGTHGQYLYDYRFPNPVTVTAPWISRSSDSKRAITNYASALAMTDEVIGRLAERVRTRRRPTAMILFGDHLPPLPRSLYLDSKLMRAEPPHEWSAEEQLRIHQTPYALVTNFPIQKAMPSRLGANCLSGAMLRALGAASPSAYDRFLEAFCEQMPYLLRAHRDPGSRLQEDYAMLVHDRLFGGKLSFDWKLLPTPSRASY